MNQNLKHVLSIFDIKRSDGLLLSDKIKGFQTKGPKSCFLQSSFWLDMFNMGCNQHVYILK